MDLFDFQTSLMHAAATFEGKTEVKPLLELVYADDSVSAIWDKNKDLKGYIFRNRYGRKMFVYKAYTPVAMSYAQAYAFCTGISFHGNHCSPGSANFLAWDLFCEERNKLLLKYGMEPIDERELWSKTPCSHNHCLVNPVLHKVSFAHDYEQFYARPVCLIR